jgi:hypothetical protein
MSARLSFRARTLRRLAELRALQRKKSEAQVAQSNVRSKHAEAAREKAAESLAADEEAWTQSLARADLALTAAWAAQAVKSAQEHRRSLRDAALADEALERARRDCSHAIARAEAIDDIARAVVKKLSARREEARLLEMADREARRLRRRP